MVFEKLVASLSNRLGSDGNPGENIMLDEELSQGMEILNWRAKQVRDLTGQLELIQNREGFDTKPLDEATENELNLVKSMQKQFEVNLSNYGMQYKQFMDNYNKFSGMVIKCKQECNNNYPVGSWMWSYSRQACKAGCTLKGPYAQQCNNTFKGDCNQFNSRCAGNVILPGNESYITDPVNADSAGVTPAKGCCGCGGGIGGPPTAMVRGSVVANCSEIHKAFGYASKGYTNNACNNAPYSSPEGAANLWKQYNSLVQLNNNLMKQAKDLFAKAQKLTSIDNQIMQKHRDNVLRLKNDTATYRDIYAKYNAMKGQTEETLIAQMEDNRLRYNAINYRYYPWLLLAVSGIAIAAYQLKKA